MAEAVAALYAVETAVEGAVVGAVAVSQSTAPLHLRFRKISSPARNREFARSGHTLNVVRGKAYVIGGEGDDGEKGTIPTLTLPVSSSTDGEGNLAPPDFEIVRPVFKDLERPLAQQIRSEESSNTNPSTFNRIGHTATAIGDKLFIWGGVELSSEVASNTGSSESRTPPSALDHAIVFDTLTKTYSLLRTNIAKSPDGTPSPRMNHTATASLDPQPTSLPDGPTIDTHGTIFIHGGRNIDGDKGGTTTLRDTWAFDVGKRIWTRLPDIPDPGPLELAGEGRISYVNGRLWRLGDGFGRAMYLDIAGSDSADKQPVLKADGKWQVIEFGTEATGTTVGVEGEKQQQGTDHPVSLPLPRLSSGVVPVTTGSGREYLLYFMGRDSMTGPLDDFWSFQIDSDKNTAASVKDKIRDAVVGKIEDSWKSGKQTWAKCVTDQGKEKAEGKGHQYPQGLYDFATDVWNDQGGNTFLIWGGKRRRTDGEEEQRLDEGWIVTVK